MSMKGWPTLPERAADDKTVHVFREAIGDRLRLMTYQFAAAIDEILHRTRFLPPDHDHPGGQEAAYHDCREDLLRALVTDNQPRERGKP